MPALRACARTTPPTCAGRSTRAEDLELVAASVRRPRPRRAPSPFPEILAHVRAHPELAAINAHVEQKRILGMPGMQLPRGVRDRRPDGRSRPPDVRDRRGRRQPQPRLGHGAAADRRRRRGGRRRGQVPDLQRAPRCTRPRRRASSTWRRSPTSRRPSCWRTSRSRANGRRAGRLRARARPALLLDPVRRAGRRRARRARRPGAEDRVVRDRRRRADPHRRGDRPPADHLDRHGRASARSRTRSPPRPTAARPPSA